MTDIAIVKVVNTPSAQIVTTPSATPTLTSGKIPKASTANSLVDSALTESTTAITSTKDMVFSGSGTGLPYGEIYTDNGVETLLLTTSFQKVENFDTEGADGVSNLMTPDHSNNKLTITTAGTYKVHALFSGKTTKVSPVYMSVFIDGVEQNNIEAEASGAENQQICIVADGLVAIAANKDIDVRLKYITGADAPTVTLAHVSLNAVMIGG
jgi:hypothetical protein